MADTEELIRDLLDPTKEKREAALDTLRNNWYLEFRPYLWKAIENEQDKQLQKRMILFTIAKLEGKALRKMIRFVENGSLYPSSVREVIRAYAQFETEEIRESLMKAILRNSKSINVFMIKLLKSRELEVMPASQIFSLLTQIFDSNCLEDQKYQYAKAVALHPQSIEPKPYLGSGFRYKFKDLIFVRKAVLDAISEQDISEAKIYKDHFIWNRTNWREVDVPKMNELDDYLIECLAIRDNKLRASVITILGKSYVTSYDYITSEQWQSFFDIWNGIFHNKIETDFIKLSDYGEKSLEEYFGENLISLYQDMRLSEIHPHNIRKLVLALIPRSLLYTMSIDDPNPENRTLCYEKLCNRDFFFTQNNGNKRLIGSIDFIYALLKRNITAMRHEGTDQAKYRSYKLFEFIIDNLFDTYIDDVNLLRKKIEEDDLLSSFQNDDQNYLTSARILLKLFSNKPITDEDIAILSKDSSLMIIREFVSKLDRIESRDFLVKLLETQKLDVRFQIISEIEELFAKREKFNDDQKAYLEIILITAKSDTNIKVRSYARLMLQKLEKRRI